jgi:hypothetical protein
MGRTAVVLGLLIAAAMAAGAGPGAEQRAEELKAYYNSLPETQLPEFDQEQAMALVTLPLACIDRPQAAPEQRQDYLWVRDGKPRLRDNYDKERAFYGCFDWHSAVNSTWTMVVILKQFPKIPVGPLIREKLKEHLSRRAIEGELEFFKTARNFEVPYGYAWLLKLYAELLTWDDADAKSWAANLKPMVEQFSKKLIEYYQDVPLPVRTGLHTNTAFSISLLLDYTEVAGDRELREIATQTANRFFARDHACPTAYEPQGTDFLSPCLAEADLMSRVLNRERFLDWFDAFLPPLYSREFKPLTEPVDVSGIKKEDLQAGKSHLIGVAFSRGMALASIARALPAGDPRIPVMRRLAILNGRSGFEALTAAGYFGSHWLATYGVMCSRAILALDAATAGTARK